MYILYSVGNFIEFEEKGRISIDGIIWDNFVKSIIGFDDEVMSMIGSVSLNILIYI